MNSSLPRPRCVNHIEKQKNVSAIDTFKLATASLPLSWASMSLQSQSSGWARFCKTTKDPAMNGLSVIFQQRKLSFQTKEYEGWSCQYHNSVEIAKNSHIAHTPGWYSVVSRIVCSNELKPDFSTPTSPAVKSVEKQELGQFIIGIIRPIKSLLWIKSAFLGGKLGVEIDIYIWWKTNGEAPMSCLFDTVTPCITGSPESKLFLSMQPSRAICWIHNKRDGNSFGYGSYTKPSLSIRSVFSVSK